VLQCLTDSLDSTHIDTPDDPVSPTRSEEIGVDPQASSDHSFTNSDSEPTPNELFDDPSSEEDDGEGDWITPSNVELHKSRALELLPGEEAPKRTRRGKGRSGGSADELESLAAGCMTADFAMQNVLLQMGLNLIGVEGKRINRVKTWVLRCHACFKYVTLTLLTAMSTYFLPKNLQGSS
jgi:RNA-binding protein NOB1